MLWRRNLIVGRIVVLVSNMVIPFSDRYIKLQNDIFPTIRRTDRYGSVGDVVEVHVRPTDERFDARIMAKQSITLNSIPDEFLVYDTRPYNGFGEDWSFEDAVEKINGFYSNEIRENEKLVLLILFKL